MSKKVVNPPKKDAKNDKILENSKIDDFRAIIRNLAADAGMSIALFLHNALDSFAVLKDKKLLLSLDDFRKGLSKFTQLKQKFSSTDLEDIFLECDESDHELISIDDLADFCQRTISRARAIALKLRLAVMKEFEGEVGYRELFAELTTSHTIESGAFIEFAEDMLGISISDSDGLDLYVLYDMDGDGKVCYEDFLGFIVGKTSEGINALRSNNPEVIVDIKVSVNSLQDAELLRSGYTQITPNSSVLSAMRPSDVAAHGTFGKGW
jgi:Ca2+-binding EF-hand superfamily protein